jgi:hypothetical protein
MTDGWMGQAKLVCRLTNTLMPGRRLKPLERFERGQFAKIDLVLHNQVSSLPRLTKA